MRQRSRIHWLRLLIAVAVVGSIMINGQCLAACSVAACQGSQIPCHKQPVNHGKSQTPCAHASLLGVGGAFLRIDPHLLRAGDMAYLPAQLLLADQAEQARTAIFPPKSPPTMAGNTFFAILRI